MWRDRIAISEEAQSVKTAPARRAGTFAVSLAFQPMSRRDAPRPGREEGGQGRPEAARRGSLDGPVSCASHHGYRSPVGLRGGPLVVPSRGRVAVLLQGQQCWRATRETGCRPSLRRDEAAWSGSAATRWAQSKWRPRRRAGAWQFSSSQRVASVPVLTPSWPGNGSRRHASRSRRG